MALTSTVLQNIRTNYPSRLDSYENRIRSTGLLTAVEEMNASPASIITPEIRERALASQGRTMQVPVIQDGDVTISNARSCAISGVENTSALVDVTWLTAVANITMVPGQYEINSIGYQADLAMKIQRSVEAFNRQIEAQLATRLDNQKSQVYTSSLVAASGAKYGLVGSAVRVTPTQQELFFNDVDAINLADDFSTGVYKVMGNGEMMPTVRQWINQGTGNANNREFQFANGRAYSTGDFDFSFSNGISNGTGVSATAYIVPDGAMGFMTRLDVDARNGHSSTKGTEWSIETLPGLSFPVALKFQSECSDQNDVSGTPTAHLTATLREHWQFSFDYAILTPYNSAIATRANPIRKIEFTS